MNPAAVAVPSAATRTAAEAAGLPVGAREPLFDLLLTLADCKRLLGIRYSDFMLGAPTLEAAIAASSMAQDEWGHGRLTYALLGDFDADPKHLEHERGAREYRNAELLDQPLGGWARFVATGLLFDTALATQYGALLDSSYVPIHNRVQKLLDEEAFHFQYFAGWARRMSAAPAVADEFAEALAATMPAVLRWFGPEGGAASAALVEAGVVLAGPDELRARLAARVSPLLPDPAIATAAPDWGDWDDAARRTPGGSGPDAESLARVRGDKNRAMLLD